MIYLTGANGFIGTKLLHYANSFNINIKVLHYCPVSNLWDGLNEIQKDDIVIHAGAHSSRSALEHVLLSKNVYATYLLARAIRTSKANLIFLSAGSVTPQKELELISFQTHPNPSDPYSWSKYACESIISEFIDSKNRIIIRLPAIYSNNLQGYGILHNWLLQSKERGVIKIESIHSKLNCFYTAELLVKFIFNLLNNFAGRKNLFYVGCYQHASIYDIAKYFCSYSKSNIETVKICSAGNYLFDIADGLSLGLTSISVFDVIDYFFKDSSFNV
jgi:nucleoside-diphosphate-sugar epimerase